MPYKSDAQRRFMHWAASKGKIKKNVVKEYDKASKGKKLPERLHKKEKTAMGGGEYIVENYPKDMKKVPQDMTAKRTQSLKPETNNETASIDFEKDAFLIKQAALAEAFNQGFMDKLADGGWLAGIGQALSGAGQALANAGQQIYGGLSNMFGGGPQQMQDPMQQQMQDPMQQGGQPGQEQQMDPAAQQQMMMQQQMQQMGGQQMQDPMQQGQGGQEMGQQVVEPPSITNTQQQNSGLSQKLRMIAGMPGPQATQMLQEAAQDPQFPEAVSQLSEQEQAALAQMIEGTNQNFIPQGPGGSQY